MASLLVDRLPPALIDRNRCQKCGRVLVEKNGTCAYCCGSKLATVVRIIGYLKPYRRQVVLLTPILALSTVAELLPPFIIQQIIDRLVEPPAMYTAIVWFVIGLLGARGMIWLCEVGRSWLVIWLGARITSDIRSQFFHGVERLPLRFFDTWQVGAIISRLTNDATKVEEFLASGLPLLFMNTLMFAAILGYLFYTSWLLTVCVLLPVPPVLLAASLFWKRLRIALDRQSESLARLSAHVGESLAGISVLKVFTQEAQEFARFERRNEDLRGWSARTERRSFTFFSVIYFLMSLGTVGAWYAGGRAVLGGSLTLGELMAVISYLWMLYWPLQWFGQINNSFAQALTGARRIFEVLDMPQEAHGFVETARISKIAGNITFRDVTFGYDSSNPVLHNINVDIAAGEVIGVVGKSGAGKTTLVNLLCRFYEPDCGTIRLDGMDIRNICYQDVRDSIGVVLQESFLFNGTIAENICYGKPTASLEEAMAAARVADAHRFVLAKPDGYDALVAERGGKLSGGEKQRIAIARTVLRSPRILILDEATSSLDVETEASIQEALARLGRNRTTFIVAHRLSTVRHAARLLVIEHGKIVETGTFDELMKRRGKFYDLAAAQGLADSSITPRTLPQVGESTMMFDPKQIRLSRDVSWTLRLTVEGIGTYDQVRVVRAAPLSDPGHYISILDSEGKEVGMVRDPLELDDLSRQIILDELQRRYITAVIQKIYSVHTEAGMSYFKVQTDRGNRNFLVHHAEENVRWLSERRLLLVDEDGNRFELPDVNALDHKSRKTLTVLQ